MFKVGLTGGIGSGKSTLARLFSKLDVCVINLDEISRQVVLPGQPALNQIEHRFGPGILTCSGELDRSKLRQRVFDSKIDREWLESLLHPLIRKRQDELIAAAPGTYVVIEIPLLVENKLAGTVDRVLVVDLPRETQIERAADRDDSTPLEITKILEAQATRQDRLAAADDVLSNDGSIEELRTKAEALHQKYLQLAARNSS